MDRILTSLMLAFGQSVNPFLVPQRANSRSGGEGLEERLKILKYERKPSLILGRAIVDDELSIAVFEGGKVKDVEKSLKLKKP